MHPALRYMLDLSALDASLRNLARQKEAAAGRIRAAEAATGEIKSRIDSLRDEAKKLQREADAMNLDVKSAEAELSKLETQLRGAKSNKEYDILRKEIDAAKQKKSQLEDAVLEKLMRADALAAEEVEARARLEQAEQELKAAKEAASRLESELGAEEDRLRKEREGIASKLDPEERRLYEKLLEQRGDSAIAKVANGFCSACACRITLQMLNLLDLGTELVQCMGCRRILYLDEKD